MYDVHVVWTDFHRLTGQVAVICNFLGYELCSTQTVVYFGVTRANFRMLWLDCESCSSV